MNDVIAQPVGEEALSIYFNEVIAPYAECFREDEFDLLPNVVKEKIQDSLIKELSYLARKTLQHELNVQTKYGKVNLRAFSEEKTIESSIHRYTYLNKILESKAEVLSKRVSKIVNRFVKDRHKIAYNFNLHIEPYMLKIVDIDVGLGDEHNGEGTALVVLSDGTKLIYKPRNCSVTKSYNFFINWINTKLQVELPTFSVLDCGDYSWLEFVNSNEISTEKGLQEYYYKAGILVAVTYLLGSKDYHNENVIASVKGPVIIDHETVVQPFLKDSFSNSWYKVYGIPSFSVLESSLIAELDKEIPVNMIGYGMKGFSTENVNQKNVPKHKGGYVFADQYKEYFVNGFSSAYDMFLRSKKELKSNESPIASFVNHEIRFVWRPTHIYAKILRYLTNPSYLINYEAYNSKLFELLSKAYKKENMHPYESILNYEMKQMLNGDIPIFHLNSQDKFLAGDKRLTVFKYSSIENINHRINLLSSAHKKEQLVYITKWLNMCS